MKKMLTFIPLAVGIGAGIIYLFNVINFRIINDAASMSLILSNMKIYLYISIAGFLAYFFIRILILLDANKKTVVTEEKVIIKEVQVPSEEKVIIKETPVIKTEVKEVMLLGNKYCSKCGEKIFDTDIYCKACGSYQQGSKSGFSKTIRKIISVLQTILLILILIFAVIMIFDYKEKNDPNFESPFKISLTK